MKQCNIDTHLCEQNNLTEMKNNEQTCKLERKQTKKVEKYRKLISKNHIPMKLYHIVRFEVKEII